jgi:hypothetical protein
MASVILDQLAEETLEEVRGRAAKQGRLEPGPQRCGPGSLTAASCSCCRQ